MSESNSTTSNSLQRNRAFQWPNEIKKKKKIITELLALYLHKTWKLVGASAHQLVVTYTRAQLYLLAKVELSSAGATWEICTSLPPSDPPARLFACPRRPLYVSLHPGSADFYHQLSWMPLKWQNEKFRRLLGQYGGHAEFRTVPGSGSVTSCTRRVLKQKVPAAERNSWHSFGFQALTVLFNSNDRNFKHVRGESRTSHLPSPLRVV